MNESQSPSPQSILDNAGITVTQGMTTPTKPGKQPRPVWTITGNTDPYIKLIYEDLGIKVRKWGGTLSCFEDPSVALATAIATSGAMSFAEQEEHKRERSGIRAERLEARAENARTQAVEVRGQAQTLASMIPFGQPVLVGHHSEGRHRRDLDRIPKKFLKSFELEKEADTLERRAKKNQREATAGYSISYLINKRDAARSGLRAMKKEEAEGITVSPERWGALEEELAYWEEQLALKGPRFEKGDIQKGDWVQWQTGVWHRVYRVNPKTVSLKYRSGRTLPCEYELIKNRVSGESAIAIFEAHGIEHEHLSETTQDLSQTPPTP
jgi:hypothetical protein